MHQSRRTCVLLFLQIVKNTYISVSPQSPSGPVYQVHQKNSTSLSDLPDCLIWTLKHISKLPGEKGCVYHSERILDDTSTSGMHLSRRTYVPLLLQTVKNIYFSIFQSHQSPSGPVCTRKTRQVFSDVQDCLIWTWKHISKLLGEKSYVNHPERILGDILSTTRDFFPERMVLFLPFWNRNPVANDTFPNLYDQDVIQLISTDRCTQSQKQKDHFLRIPIRKTRRCPPPRDVAETQKAPGGDIPTSVPSTTFPLLPLLRLLSWSAYGYYAARLAATRMLSPSL